MVSTGKVIVMTASTVKGMAIASVVPVIIIVLAGRGIILIMKVMRRKIGFTLTIAINTMIRPFAIIVSVHNGISAAVSIIARIICISAVDKTGTSAGQQRKTGEQHFFGDRIHSIARDS